MTPYRTDRTKQAQRTANSRRLYIVDDDAAVRDALTLVGELVGLRYEAYDSAEAFLARLDAAKPGCLILDVRMRGMSGWELVQALAARGISWPIIVITGHCDPDDDYPLENGVIAVLHKPFDIQRLNAHITQAMAQLDQISAMAEPVDATPGVVPTREMKHRLNRIERHWK